MVRMLILLLVTVFLLVTTIVAHREKQTWAWARFFAFELCIALILLNAPQWFHNPFSPVQLLSWVFLAASIFLVLQGFILLKQRGQPDGHFERTTTLVTTGVYQYIRHPMYASLFYLTLGAWLKDVNLISVLVAVASCVAAAATANIEERDCLRKFGNEYREYMEKTKRFVPFVF